MARHDTNDGGGYAHFPQTRHSAIQALKVGNADERRRALDVIVSAYWKPVYKYLRTKWHQNRESAEDTTQSFFVKVVEKDYLASFDAAKARFRTFLRVCVDRFVQHEIQAQSRMKRGGHLEFIDYDFASAERELSSLTSVESNAERFFENEWIRSLLSSAVDELRQHCKEKDKKLAFQLFESHDLEKLQSDETASYKQSAEAFSVSVETVTNHLAYARREFRRIVLDRLRDMTASDDEFRSEVRTVLGIEAP